MSFKKFVAAGVALTVLLLLAWAILTPLRFQFWLDGLREDALSTVKVQAHEGDADAQYFLGLHHAIGDILPRDEREAVLWYQRAAEQGHAEAQFNLGVCYAEGVGVPEDDAEAATWFRKAAEQGNPFGQFNLARAYRDGVGVAADPVQAYKWLILASVELQSARTERDELHSKVMPAEITAAEDLVSEFASSGAREGTSSADENEAWRGAPESAVAAP